MDSARPLRPAPAAVSTSNAVSASMTVASIGGVREEDCLEGAESQSRVFARGLGQVVTPQAVRVFGPAIEVEHTRLRGPSTMQPAR